MDLFGCWLAEPNPVSIEPTFVFIDIDDTTVESTSIDFNRFTIASECGSIYYELDISSSSDSNFNFSDKYTFTEAASASKSTINLSQVRTYPLGDLTIKIDAWLNIDSVDPADADDSPVSIEFTIKVLACLDEPL